MADDFAKLIQTAIGFFQDLARNNTREWFNERKTHYTDEIKKPAEFFAGLLADDLARLTGKPHGAKIFRIHRDVRFSKDKTPYNTYLHIMWQQPGDAPRPVWFFGAAPDYLRLGTGMMFRTSAALDRYRAFVDQAGDAIDAAITKADGTFESWGNEPLKRVPKPYPQDHPHAELLKRKNLSVSTQPDPSWRADGLYPAILTTAERLLPLWRLLDDDMA